jgi:hypothetical protein
MKWRASLRAVLSAFFGVRRAATVHEDEKLPVWLLIVTAVLLAAVFIGGLLLIVNLVV